MAKGRKYKCDKLDLKIQEQLLSLHNQGYSNNYLEKYLEDLGIDIKANSIASWLNFKLKNKTFTEKTLENSISKNEKFERDCEPNPVIDTPEEIKNILSEIGFLEDTINLENSELIIGLCQRLLSKNYLTIQLIIANRLNKFKKGKTKFPLEQIKASGILYHQVDIFLAIDETVSLDKSFQALKNAGYPVDSIFEDVELMEKWRIFMESNSSDLEDID